MASPVGRPFFLPRRVDGSAWTADGDPYESGTTISVPVGSLSMSGAVPTVVVDSNSVTVNVPLGAISVSGSVPIVSTGGVEATEYTPTHYVTAAASGSGDGSLGDPWTLAQAMANAVAGNVVRVGPGAYTGSPSGFWNPGWYPANNGTSGNEIVFYAQYPAAYNTDAPASCSKLRSDTVSYPTYGGRGYAGTNTSYVIWDGFWTDQADGSYPVASNGQCNIGGGTHHITIRRGLFDRGEIDGGDNYAAIFMQQTDNITIEDCLFRGGAASAGGSHNNAAISFYNCEDALVEHCTFEDMECGIFVKAHRDTADGNTGVIRFNKFDNCEVTGIEFNEVDIAKGGMDFYQNLLIDCGIKFDWSSDVTGKNARVYNNTIIGRADSETNCLAVFPSSYTNSITIRDNIFVGNAAMTYDMYAHDAGADPDDAAYWDYNCWYRSSGSFRFRYNGTTYSGLSAWQAAKAVDDNSIESNPEFVGGGDYRLDSNGQAALTASSIGGKLGCYLTNAEEIGLRATPDYDNPITINVPAASVVATGLIPTASVSGEEVTHGYTPTHYATVAGAGSHNGTVGNEWSVPEAFANAVAGNIVEFAPGTYTTAVPSGLYPAASGTEENPIVFVAQYPAVHNLGNSSLWTQIHATGTGARHCFSNDRIVSGSRQYIVLDGFRTYQGVGNVFDGTGHHIALHNNTLGSHNWKIRRILFDQENFATVGTPGYLGTDNYGAIWTQGTDGVEISDCKMTRFYGSGPNLTMWTMYGANSVSMHNCHIEDVSQSVYIKGSQASGWNAPMEFHHNFVKNTRAMSILPNVAGEVIGAPFVDIYQNIFVAESGYTLGLRSSGSPSSDNPLSVRVVNNTFVGKAGHLLVGADDGIAGFWSWPNFVAGVTCGTECYVRNNIWAPTATIQRYMGGTQGTDAVGVARVNSDYNLHPAAAENNYGHLGTSTKADWTTASGREGNTIFGDPTFVDSDADDYRLTGGSEGLGDGVDILDLLGGGTSGAINIGADIGDDSVIGIRSAEVINAESFNWAYPFLPVGWTLADASSSEQSGAIPSLPYADMFITNPVSGGRVAVPSAGSIAWAPGAGWNGANAILATLPSTGQEDDAGIAAQALPGTNRRICMGYVIKFNSVLAAGVDDSKKMLLTRYYNGSPVGPGNEGPNGTYTDGGPYRFNAQGLNFGGVGSFPAGTYQLVMPQRGVAWAQMPSTDADADDFAIDSRNQDTYLWLGCEADLDTGLFAVYQCEEGQPVRLLYAINIYNPPRGAEGEWPTWPDAEPLESLVRTYWGATGGPGGFPYWEGISGGAQAWISHYYVSAEYAGPPAGFTPYPSKPTVEGRQFVTGYFGSGVQYYNDVVDGNSQYVPTHYVSAYEGGVGPGSSDTDVQNGAAYAAATNPSTPCTLACAMANAVAGNQVQVNPGQYIGPANNGRWDAGFKPANSGTAINPIVFFAKFRAGTTYQPGVTTELRSGATTSSGSPAFGVTNQDYAIFDGFYTDHNQSNNKSSADTGPCVVNGSIGSQIRACVILGELGWATGDNYNGIRFEQAENCVAIDCYIKDFKTDGISVSQNYCGFMAYDCLNSSIEHSEITNCGVGAWYKGWHHGSGQATGTPTDTVITVSAGDVNEAADHYNGNLAFFHDGARAYEYRTVQDWGGGDRTVTLDTALSGAPGVGDTLYMSEYATYASGCHIKFCHLYGNQIANIRYSGVLERYQNQCYGNLLSGADSHMVFASFDPTGPANVAFVNNTIVGSGADQGMHFADGGGGPFDLTLQNNIFSGVDSVYYVQPGSVLSELLDRLTVNDYNLYYNYGDFSVSEGGGTIGSATFASYGETNSIDGSNPNFVGGSDYSLEVGSPAIGAGVDILNLLRNGTSGAINMGAYFSNEVPGRRGVLALNNPDAYPEVGNLWMDNAYETEVAEEKSQNSYCTSVWASNYGRGGSGGWRSIPNAIDFDENHCGWAGAEWTGSDYSNAGNGSNRFFLSFTMLLSQDMIDNVLVESAGRMKFLDIANGVAGNNRWLMSVPGAAQIPTAGGLKLGFAAGGAGTDLYDDGVNTNWDLSLYPDEFIWFCIVADAANTEMRLYAKRQGDSGVSLLLVRDETTNFGGEFFENGGSGWSMPLQSIGGYWDWQRESMSSPFSFSTSQYMTLDDMKLADYWTGPPF